MAEEASKASDEGMEPDAPNNGRKTPFGKKRAGDRRCVATNDPLPPEAPALRFVQGPAQEVVLDLKGNLPGRGAWLRPERDKLMLALKRGGFARGFKGEAKLPEGLDADGFADHVAERLQHAALQKLGLARKAGSLKIGHDAVRKAAKSGLAYLTPTDASAPEVEKLARFLAKAEGVPHVPLPADRVTLSGPLDQDAVHLLLVLGGPSRGVLESIEIWRRFSSESRA
ncbi:MAG: DUF448 domain-containing protein [Parvularculaceae bacterium]|nr:DUF448 domain-containing protein [Parvularculaceae bacterium]